MHLHWLDGVALVASLSTIAVNGVRLIKSFSRRRIKKEEQQ